MIASPPAGLEIHNVVDLFMKATESVNGLWSFYMAGSFAAAGFAASARHLSLRSAGAITVGYIIFLAGHLSLLNQGITIQLAAAKDLASIPHIPGEFQRSVTTIVNSRISKTPPVLIHIGIDLCILSIIWMRALRPEQNDNAKKE